MDNRAFFFPDDIKRGVDAIRHAAHGVPADHPATWDKVPWDLVEAIYRAGVDRALDAVLILVGVKDG